MKWSSKPGTRQLCVFALLLGLIGMHGLAGGEGAGCHGGMSSLAPVTAMTAAMPTDISAASQMVALTRSTSGSAMGSVCVSVQSAGWPAVALALLAIAGSAAGSGASSRRAARDDRGRSPPLAGVSILRRVCVSLT
jgi:hypothetical protein